MSERRDVGVVVKSSLAPAGPLERIDRAFVLARRGGAELTLRAWLAGGLPALALLAYYYAERVEGVGALRLPAAAALVAAFLIRGWALAGVARRYVRALSERAPIGDDAGGFLAVARTAVVVGAGLWLWAWGLVISAGGGSIGIALFVPLLAFRGLVAPSWLARAGCAPEAGFRAFARATRDTTYQRMESLLVESLLLLALFGIAANLYGIFGFVVTIGRSFLGLEMALVDEFLSFRNTFVLLAVSLAAAVSLEPLRAALSAQVYVDARVRAEGLDLRAALDEAIAHTTRASRGDRSVRAVDAAQKVATLLLACTLGLATAQATAQAPDPTQPIDPAGAPEITEPAEPASGEAPSPTWTAHDEGASDREAREQARVILAGDIFRDVEQRRHDGLADLLSRLFEWLIERFADDDEPTRATGTALPSLPLPGPTFFLVVGGLFVVAVAVFLLLTRRRDQSAARAMAAAAGELVPDPRDRSPDDWLNEAASLAARGKHGEALRALYLGTLVALDRRAWIRFESSLTNWQYLRQMPAGPARDAFRAMTRTFDVKIYGEEPAVARDYEESRALAVRILEVSRPSLPPPPPGEAAEASG